MGCTVNECFKHIKDWFNTRRKGFVMVVNAENDKDYRAILERLEADAGKKKHYISDFFYNDYLGNIEVDEAIRASTASEPEDHVLIGFSLIGLFDKVRLEDRLKKLVKKRDAKGKCLVLTEHCAYYLKDFMKSDPRLPDRVVLVEGSSSKLPEIQILKNKDDIINTMPLNSMQDLFKELEKGNPHENDKFSVVSDSKIGSFSNSAYPVKEAPDIFEQINDIDTNIRVLEKKYGKDEQWKKLAKNIKKHGTLYSFFEAEFGDLKVLDTNFCKYAKRSNKDKWMLWLAMKYGEAMKYFGVNGSSYLLNAVKKSDSYDDLLEHLYNDLAEVDCLQSDFAQAYQDRKEIIHELTAKPSLTSEYCERLRKLQGKKAIYYLTDLTDKEKKFFMECLSNAKYDYSPSEVKRAVSTMSKDLESYMKDFFFDATNTYLSELDAPLYEELTDYFKRYKWQKLTKLSDIDKDFLDVVEKYARANPHLHTKLREREDILNNLASSLDKETTQTYFFDALGVEYLSFILDKCKEYALSCNVSIGHCYLPSTTEQNKPHIDNFLENQGFKLSCREIDTLDKIKHHKQRCDYEKCECPVYLFNELSVIDDELVKIQDDISSGKVSRVLIASDHGASRLAVLHGKKCVKIGLKEKGEKSGRCCKVDENPGIDCAVYENGFAVLANYDRFKGSHAAEVEVHGGAALEEVLVPIIILSRLRKDIHIGFTKSTLKLVPHEQLKLELSFNVAIKEPKLHINGKSYKGQKVEEHKAVFDISDIKKNIKRRGTYTYCADVYDGDTKLPVAPLNFDIEKPQMAKENDVFNLEF